jgi:hypothetical protein
MGARGRPIKSDVRQNIIEILAEIGSGYGYQIHKYYNELFPACTRENIYYNLRKGVALKEFELVEIRREEGAFSWGTVVEKKIYRLGPKSAPRGNPKVKEFFEKLKQIKQAKKKKPKT